MSKTEIELLKQIVKSYNFPENPLTEKPLATKKELDALATIKQLFS